MTYNSNPYKRYGSILYALASIWTSRSHAALHAAYLDTIIQCCGLLIVLQARHVCGRPEMCRLGDGVNKWMNGYSTGKKLTFKELTKNKDSRPIIINNRKPSAFYM